MKINEAKKIIGYLIEWQFVLMGVKEVSDIGERMDLSKYSLADLLRANAIVIASENRKKKIREFHRAKGHVVKPCFIQMNAADRLIAAVYTAMHFEANGEAVALINDKMVGVVKAEYD